MALRAAQGKLHPLVLPTNQLWQQLWGRAPLSQDVLAELMKQAECPRAARLVALRSMACGEELSPAMYDRLIHLHVHHGDPQGALRLLGSAKLPIQGYEALLRSLVETNRTAKAWEVFENLRTQELMEPTENMIVSMLHACLTEKNPDAADRLVDEFTRWTTEIELAHIAVLTTRQRTLGKALERYGQFLERNPPNVECQRRLMQACERCGHTERAKILWRKIRSQNQDLKNVDAETVVSYIRVFKNADIPQKEKEKAVKYLWSLVLELEVSAPLLNALISVFGSAGLLKNVMETWESFASFQRTPDGGTYEALLEATTTNHKCFTKVWTELIGSEFEPTPRMYDLALETLVRFDDLNKVMGVLAQMHIKKVPLRRDMSKEGARYPPMEQLLRNFA